MYEKWFYYFQFQALKMFFRHVAFCLSYFTLHKLSFNYWGAWRMLIVPDETIKDDAGSG